MARFRIGLTITADTLFGFISKMLPIEDLQVQEIMGQEPAPVPVPVPDPAIRFDRRFDLPKPSKKYKRKPARPMDLNTGINKIIMEAMSDGKPHHAVEFRALLAERDYSPNSVGSRMQNLERHSIVRRVGNGAWKLTNAGHDLDNEGRETYSNTPNGT